MTNNFYGGYNPNPYQQQLQQLQQRVQAMQPIVNPVQPQSVAPEDKIVTVTSEDVAKNTNIPLDGSTTYFKYGDLIMSRRWDISEGKVCNTIYKIQQDDPTIQEIEEKPDRLKGIEDTLQEILKKVTYPINGKKGVKQDVE